MDDTYPNARGAYRFQYIHEYLLAPPDPLLVRWMRQRKQESSGSISEHFHAFVTEWQNTPVLIEGCVVEEYLPEHPVQGTLLITWKDGYSHTVAVEDGTYQWQGPVYLLWDGVESDWMSLEFQFQRTEGIMQDHYLPLMQTTLPVLLRTAGITMNSGVLETSMPGMYVVHFCDVSLADDVRFNLYGPRVSRNQPTDRPGARPYGRYQLVVGSASADLVLNKPEKTLATPGRTSIPEMTTWADPEFEQLLQEPDPLKSFIIYEEEMRDAMLTRMEVLMGEIRRLRDDHGDASETVEQIQQLEAEREAQQDAMSHISEGETRFRKFLQEHEQKEREL